MLVKKTFYLVKLHNVQIPIHSNGVNFITHSLYISYQNPFSVMLRLPISCPIQKKKGSNPCKSIQHFIYLHTHFIPNTKKAISLHIQRAWITYPFHYNSFEGSKSLISLHTHFIPSQRAWITYPFITIHSLPISYPKTMNKVKNLVRS